MEVVDPPVVAPPVVAPPVVAPPVVAPPVVAPPVVANAEAQRRLNAEAQDVEGPPYLRVARAAKRLEVAKALNDFEMITEEELGQHDGFHLICTAVASGGVVAPGGAVIAGGGAPDWFAPALAAELARHEARIEARIGARIEGRIDDLEARIGARFNNVEARQRNSLASKGMDSLSEIQNAAGVVFPDFPEDVQALYNMDGRAMQAFLEFYELPADRSLQNRQQRIKAFIGMH